jgi:hypothetical protein
VLRFPHMAPRAKAQEHITNLANDLIMQALDTVQRQAFPVYQRNAEDRESLAHGEFRPCAAAILLITAGIDFHLARLKYFRDLARYKRPFPHTPYFDWDIDKFLIVKIKKLLIRPSEKRLKQQLLELTAMRDSVAHPKLYLIRELVKPDLSVSKPKATQSGWKHWDKTAALKLKRSERTQLLRLPLVPTWISYVDMVVCILVMSRFFSALETKYGPWYSMLGGLMARNDPPTFFEGWKSTRKTISLNDWAQAFFNSLSDTDKNTVKKRLGENVSIYVSKPRPPSWRNPWKPAPEPEFLRNPPPWPCPCPACATPP